MEALNYSSIESMRFNLKVYRGIFNEIDPSDFLTTVIKERVDIAIIRIPSERQDSLLRLDKTSLPYLIADTLVYYYVDLKTYEPKKLCNQNLEFVEFTPKHFKIMNKLVSEIFFAYKSHYTSNPLLAADMVEIYKEWTRGYVTDKIKGKQSWLVKRGNLFIGFATCSFERDESEGVLLGVLPSATGGGVYGDLIRFIQRFFKDNNYSTMKISTQVYNYAVQKVWGREGFFMKKSFYTLHVNSLMNASQIKKELFELTFSSDDVRQYSDMNRLQFEEKYTCGKGIKERTVPELMINSIISKYYSEVFPGNDTVTNGCSYKFLKPIHQDQPYRFEISFPFVNPEKGVYKSLVRISDSDGDVCLFSYNDLKKNECICGLG